MSALEGGGRLLAWPAPLAALAALLREELAAYPGRGNVTMRCVLGGALVIVASMTLHVPELPLSLMAVFYVTQANIVLSRLVAVGLLIGTTCAIAVTIGLLKLTFDYPLLRIVVASAIFFCSTYLIRAIAKLGLVFFLVSLIVFYAQTFVDLTDNAEVLVRACLWVWVAVNYAVALALVINTLFLPAEPQRQLRAAMQRQLSTVRARLAMLIDAQAPRVQIGARELERGALSLQKLVHFAAMREHYSNEDMSTMLACVSAVARIFQAAAVLPDHVVAQGAGQIEALQSELLSLERTLGDDTRSIVWRAPREAPESMPFAALDAMQRALIALSNATSGDATQKPTSDTPAAAPPEPGLFANPRYARFSLRTLLSMLICYVFYNAVNWPGIHTVMLTSLVVALPSLGASARHGLLRISGALLGSGLALFMVAFVIPHLESVTGLLLMCLPVIALGAWVSAGSERIGYAGIQIMFTFSLALLASFSPPSDLTEIRDRMVGILLGVGVATFIQMSVWPEGEADTLRAQLASVLREIAALARVSAKAMLSGARPSDAQAVSAAWAALADCDAVLARVASEPDWREDDATRITLLSQTVLAQSRVLLGALEAFHDQAMSAASTGVPVAKAATFQSAVAHALEQYASQLAAEPPAAATPVNIEPGLSRIERANAATAATEAVLQAHAQRIDAALAGLPRWTAAGRAGSEFASAG